MIKLIKEMRKTFYRRAFFSAFTSSILLIGFITYNLVVGIIYNLLFNITMAIYYILLFFIKLSILITELYCVKYKKDYREKTYNITFFLLLVLTCLLIGPTILMIDDMRTVSYNLITAIGYAAFTFTFLTLAIYNSVKGKSNENYLVKQIRTISVITSLTSILLLQNTLISVNGGYDEGMILLSKFTSFGVLFFNIVFILLSYRKYKKHQKN